MSTNKRKKEWFVIIGVAIALHLVLFLSVKPDFFQAFKKSTEASTGLASGSASMPEAIYTIPIEIDDGDEPAEREMEQPRPPSTRKKKRDESLTPPQEDSESPGTSFDLETLIGEAPQTLPGSQGQQGVAIPPRPLEITWPDTRDLKHCLGHLIDVRIEVSETGEILQVDAERQSHPPDCVEAALESARRIVFEPGEIDGRPARMWTKVRIDFRKKG